jgi:hypothetical protein
MNVREVGNIDVALSKCRCAIPEGIDVDPWGTQSMYLDKTAGAITRTPAAINERMESTDPTL